MSLLSLNIPEQVYSKIRNAADREGVSINLIAEQALVEAFPPSNTIHTPDFYTKVCDLLQNDWIKQEVLSTHAISDTQEDFAELELNKTWFEHLQRESN